MPSNADPVEVGSKHPGLLAGHVGNLDTGGTGAPGAMELRCDYLAPLIPPFDGLGPQTGAAALAQSEHLDRSPHTPAWDEHRCID